MPAKSEKQRKFFGAVMSAKKGGKSSKEAKKAAKGMSKEKVKHYLKKEDVGMKTFKNFFVEVTCPGGKIRSGGMGRGLGIGGGRGPIGRRRLLNRRVRRGSLGRGRGGLGRGLGPRGGGGGGLGRGA